MLDTSLFKPGDRVGVAVSGGADSVALLRILMERRSDLGLVLSVVHFNHKLRGMESDTDECFVAELASSYDLSFFRAEAETATFAREKAMSIEAAARDLRYAFFGRLIREAEFDKVATAHTRDDQAETVLLRIIRGTGTSGLAGILPKLKVGEGAVVRPMLEVRRADVLQYLGALGQSWREDSTNSETVYTRNRLRHELLPEIAQNFNPEIHESLANLAEIARAEDEFWASETAEAYVRCSTGKSLSVTEVRRLHLALQRRVLRLVSIQAGASLDFAHTERVLAMLNSGSRREKVIELPGGFRAVMEGDSFFFESDEPQAKPCEFSYLLSIPGKVDIPEIRVAIRASVEDEVEGGALRLSEIPNGLTVRNWRPGDRFWPEHTKSEKKVKELLQEKKVPSREKSLWPVALVGDEVVWMRGFGVSARHAAKAGERAVVIEALPL